jgi:hypothetical protein
MTDFDAEPAVTALRAGPLGAPPTPSRELGSWFVSPPPLELDVAPAPSWRRRLAVWLGGLGLGAKLALGAGVAVASVGLAGTAEVLPGPVQDAFDHSIGRGGSGDPQPDLPDRAPVSPSPDASPSGKGPTPSTSTSPSAAATGDAGPVTPSSEDGGATTASSTQHDDGGTEPSSDDTSGAEEPGDSPGTTDPKSSDPETSDSPETSDPETTDPQTSDPETSDPETSDSPDTTTPETTAPAEPGEDGQPTGDAESVAGAPDGQ